jgi:prophage DNA circulation protein
MSDFLESQLQGKFKNIPFSITRETLDNVGQALVVHTYPKSSVQYLEPMGENPFEASVDLFFHGDNAKDIFQSFQQAIKDPAPGRLYLPTFGIFDNIKAQPTAFTSDQKTLGKITASVKFSSSIDRPSPIDSEISEQDVAEKSVQAMAVLNDSFTADYVEPSTGNNFLTAVTDALGISDEIKEITGLIKETRNFARRVDVSIREVDKYAALLLNPGQPIGYLQSILLSTRNTGAFSLYTRIANVGKNQSNSMNDITSGITPKTSTVFPAQPVSLQIDTNINLWNDDTLERTERNTGRLAVINTFRITGLIGMFESAANANYTTTEEIDKTTLVLENYYTTLVENDATCIIICSIKSIIDELRNLTDKVLARKRQQAYGVIEINEVRPISSVLLSYKLYGELIKKEENLFYMASIVAGLNRNQPAHALSGTIRVVEIARA